MKVYRVDEHQIGKPAKFVELPDGYQVTNNDGTIRMELRHTTVMDGSMESSFYHTVMWIEEDGGWKQVNNTQSFKSKEDFIDAICGSEDFTEAVSEYKFNNQKQQ